MNPRRKSSDVGKRSFPLLSSSISSPLMRASRDETVDPPSLLPGLPQSSSAHSIHVGLFFPPPQSQCRAEAQRLFNSVPTAFVFITFGK